MKTNHIISLSFCNFFFPDNLKDKTTNTLTCQECGVSLYHVKVNLMLSSYSFNGCLTHYPSK